MKLSEILRLVIVNIFQNKVKILLTSLGIIAGASTVVAVIAIGRGGEEQVKAQFSGLSAETIYVNPNYSKVFNLDYIPPLTIEHMEFIMNESTALSGLYLRGNTYKEIDVDGIKNQTSIVGVTAGYEVVSNLTLIAGRTIDGLDIEEGSHVAVIGDGLAKRYYNNTHDAVGKSIRIANRTYQIVGVLERTGDGMQGLSPDDTVFVPYSNAQEYLFDDFVTPQLVGLAKNID